MTREPFWATRCETFKLISTYKCLDSAIVMRNMLQRETHPRALVGMVGVCNSMKVHELNSTLVQFLDRGKYILLCVCV
jgi:hypothetical protein